MKILTALLVFFTVVSFGKPLHDAKTRGAKEAGQADDCTVDLRQEGLKNNDKLGCEARMIECKFPIGGVDLLCCNKAEKGDLVIEGDHKIPKGGSFKRKDNKTDGDIVGFSHPGVKGKGSFPAFELKCIEFGRSRGVGLDSMK